MDKGIRDLIRKHEQLGEPLVLTQIEHAAGKGVAEARKYLAKLKRLERSGPLVVPFFEMLKHLDLPLWDSLSEGNVDYFADYASHSISGEEFESEEARDEAFLKAEMEAEQELFQKWRGTVENVIKTYCEYVGLDTKFSEESVTLTPHDHPKGWTPVATRLVGIINGVGLFVFDDVSQFVRVGPYKSAKQAVQEHLHWLKEYGSVYGARSPESLYNLWMAR